MKAESIVSYYFDMCYKKRKVKLCRFVERRCFSPIQRFTLDQLSLPRHGLNDKNKKLKQMTVKFRVSQLGQEQYIVITPPTVIVGC